MVLTIDTAAKISIDFIDCKWLDLDKVCLRYIDLSREEFSGIKYFTTLSEANVSTKTTSIYWRFNNKLRKP